MRSGAVILAAGLSSRMGEFKPLLQLGGKSLLERCVSCMKDAGVDLPLVITGHNGEKVQEEARRIGIQAIHNDNFTDGMFSSVKKGIEAMKDVDAFFILPVDIPLIRPATVQKLIKEYSNQDIIYPEFSGECGHPPLISAELRNEILEAEGTGGLAAVLNRHHGNILPVWDRFILCDADTPEAFTTLQQAATRYDILSVEEAKELARQTMPEHIIMHCCLVAEIALVLEKGLTKAGWPPLDRELIESSALLHDICKGQPAHEKAGENLLASLGLSRMAEIVGAHRDVEPPANGTLREKELVCLADRMAHGSERVSYDERFRQKLSDYQGNEEACYWIRHRYHHTRQLVACWEHNAKMELENWLAKEGL